jgi:beta-galactosidase
MKKPIKLFSIKHCCFAILLFIATDGHSQDKDRQLSLPVAKIEKVNSFKPGEIWLDESGNSINAHGGGLLFTNNRYYWFGEARGRGASHGVNAYSSLDLYNWKYEGTALAQQQDTTSDITRGSVMERPKVMFNEKTGKYVMWFHLELRGQGYRAARAGVAVSDKAEGPYNFVGSFRPNGNMSRDMTLFKDDDGAAYLVYSSRDNYDLRVARLSDDFLTVTPTDSLLFSSHREAPSLFKHNNVYYLITSGCTGWTPNKATLHTAKSVWGPWEQSPGNPMSGPNADRTFDGQSTYILPVAGKKDQWIFMADRWKPGDLKDSRYLWLPLRFTNGSLVVQWMDEWKLDFSKKN